MLRPKVLRRKLRVWTTYAAIFGMLFTGTPGVSLAATYTWNGSGSTWSTATDWTPNGVPLAADTAVFNSTSGTGSTITVTASTVFDNLVFDTTTTGLGSFTFTGGSFTPTAGGSITINNNGTFTGYENISSGITLAAGAFTLANYNTGGTLSIGGNITGAASSTLTLGGNGAGNISGIVSGTTQSLAVNGGNWTLSGVNTYAGATILSGGTLAATTSASALGAGALTLSGGALNLSNTSGTSLSFGRNTTVTAPANVSGYQAITGNVASIITSDVSAVGAGNVYTMGTLAIGAQTLTVNGGPNVTSGVAGLTFGAVSLSGSPTFTVNNPAGGGNTLLTLGNVSPGANVMTFNGTGATTFAGSTVTIGASTSIFNNGTGAALNLGNLSQGAFTLTTGGTGGITAGNVALTGAAVFTNTSGFNSSFYPLSITGNITGTQNLTFESTSLSGAFGAGGINVSGNIQTSTGTVTVNSPAGNAGTVWLSGANTYSGATVLTAGALRATSGATSGALGTGALTLSGANSTLELVNAPGSSSLAFGNNATVSASMSILSGLTSLGAGNTYTLGTLSMGAQTLTVGAGEFVTSGTAGVTFGVTTISATGATINVNNSFYQTDPFSSNSLPTTTTQLNLASLTGTNTAVTFGGTGNLTTGAVTTGTGTLTKNGTGTVTLTGTNTNTGLLTINSGSVVVAQGGALVSTLPITFGAAGIGSGSFVENFAATGTNTQALGALTVLGGGNTVQANYGTSGTDSLTFSSFVAPTATGGATINFATSGGTNGTTNSIVLTGASNTAGILSPAAFYTSGTNTDFAVINSTGSYVRALNYGVDASSNIVAAGYGGALAGSAGLITATSNNELTTASGLSGTIVQNVGVTAITLKMSGAITLDVGGTVVLQTAVTSGSGGIIATGGASTIYGVGGIETNATGQLVINTPLATDSLTIASQIIGNTTNTMPLVKTGAGTLILQNPANLVGVNSSYTGAIYIDGGTLSITGTSVTDPLTLGSQTTRTIDLNGGTFQITGSAGLFTLDKTFSVNAAGGTLDVGSSTLTIGMQTGTASLLTGTGNLTIGGSTTSQGTVFLDNKDATFSGNISVNAGTLRLGGATNAAGTAGTLIVGSGATLDVVVPGVVDSQGTNTTGNSGAITNPLVLTGTGVNGGGALTNSSPYTTMFTGAVTLAGNTTITSGGSGGM
ncbi:MAG TPA: autotransporter-associated beta strand repeat-containing protein, partial [Pirellulales bacterium]